MCGYFTGISDNWHCQEFCAKHRLQFRPSREGEPFRNQAAQNSHYFNSRPLARANCAPFLPIRRSQNFNSRPLARANRVKKVRYNCILISIHALSRGRTLPNASVALVTTISIHALSRGRTDGEKIFGRRSFYFNSRPLARANLIPGNWWAHWLFQFTPSREGERKNTRRGCRSNRFQFTPSREGELSSPKCGLEANKFQFTPSREGER